MVQRYYLGMSEKEMAEQGASPPGTIKWRLHAAKKSLGKLLRSQFRAKNAQVPPEGMVPVAAVPSEVAKGGNNHE